ncbi:MGMT family protein [Arthrobacter sp. M4]|uniref:MGMT family protein n=1 Tax=Arthrobacter sp. M4 TaxID=218160 RepID=UPI001CDCA6BD|nr:MGMT family protein [Arthrobacter sp. M4]MCA4132326.1 MGMT family protein [Arthrobacter sp. M4]
MRMEYVTAVLGVVDLIPPGTAVSYGDVAELLGAGGPRQVGAVMSRYGSGVPWWRVLKASGEAPPGHEPEALRHYVTEHTPLRGDHERFLRTGEGRWRVDLGKARWAPTEGDFDVIDVISDQLERHLHRLSVADDGMSV